jgi:hypothetical protein
MKRTGRSFRRTSFCALAVCAALVFHGMAGLSRADELELPQSRELPTAHEFDESLPEGGRLTGRQIYERFLDNRAKAVYQKIRIVSSDPGGAHQVTRFKAHAQDNRDEEDRAVEQVLARTLIEISDPFDMRHTKYLIIAKDPGPDDQFVYRPQVRKVSRVNLQNTTLLGTDFSFDDLGFQNIEDAEYQRFADEMIGGRDVYVVEAVVKDKSRSDYGRSLVYLEKEHYVPLRTRYWDHAEVESKELVSNPKTITRYDDVWVARESRMHNRLERTFSTLYVEDLKQNPIIRKTLFSVRSLARGR